MQVTIHASLTLALDRGGRWASRSRRLTSDTIQFEDTVRPTAGK
jgi:hypothetical protein